METEDMFNAIREGDIDLDTFWHWLDDIRLAEYDDGVKEGERRGYNEGHRDGFVDCFRENRLNNGY